MAANTVQQAAVSAGPHRYPWTAGYTGTDGHVTEGFIDAYGFYLMNQAQRELATHPNSVSTRKLAGVKITPRAAMSADPAAQLPDANVLVLPGGGAVNISAFDFTWGCVRQLGIIIILGPFHTQFQAHPPPPPAPRAVCSAVLIGC